MKVSVSFHDHSFLSSTITFGFLTQLTSLILSLSNWLLEIWGYSIKYIYVVSSLHDVFLLQVMFALTYLFSCVCQFFSSFPWATHDIYLFVCLCTFWLKLSYISLKDYDISHEQIHILVIFFCIYRFSI